MVRIAIPLVEVTAPDGTKAFWAAYSIPHNKAVEAVRSRIPADHIAELSPQRFSRRWKLDGANPGDVIKLEHRVISSPDAKKIASAPSAALPKRPPRTRTKDLNKLAEQLLASVRNMPPGDQRYEALKEVGRLRSRLHAHLQSKTIR